LDPETQPAARAQYVHDRDKQLCHCIRKCMSSCLLYTIDSLKTGAAGLLFQLGSRLVGCVHNEPACRLYPCRLLCSAPTGCEGSTPLLFWSGHRAPWDQLSPRPAAGPPLNKKNTYLLYMTTYVVKETCRHHQWHLRMRLRMPLRLQLCCAQQTQGPHLVGPIVHALVVLWWLVLHFKGSGPQPSLKQAALPLHTQVHVFMSSFHLNSA